MAKIYHSAEELVGRTPLVELERLRRAEGLSCRLLAKLECFNPAGSAKDRVALNLLDTAEAAGALKKDSVIIEPTSGNTGIALAAIGCARGYRVILVMPATASVERQKLIRAYGAEVVLTDGALGMRGAIEEADRLAREFAHTFIPSQFTNPENSAAHYRTTGPEIWEDTEGEVDVFVAGVGTGGTISGSARYLKEQNRSVHVVALEPADSPVLSGGKAGAHALQGIGAGFVPEICDTSVIDEILTATTEEAYAAARSLAKREGILVGISSGAALSAALKVARRPEWKDKTVVVLLPDTGERYLSTDLFSE